jgi:hypothetical protein
VIDYQITDEIGYQASAQSTGGRCPTTAWAAGRRRATTLARVPADRPHQMQLAAAFRLAGVVPGRASVASQYFVRRTDVT